MVIMIYSWNKRNFLENIKIIPLRERERQGDINFCFGKTFLLSVLIFCINPGLCLYLLVFANTWNVCFSVKFQSSPEVRRLGEGWM